MKIKNIFLSVALIMGSCLAAVPADVRPNEKAEQVKEAKKKYSKFRNVMRCVRNWKGCTREERRDAVIYGFGTLAAIAALGTGIGYVLWRRGKRAAVPAVPAAEGRSGVLPGPSTPGGELAAAAVPSASMATPFERREEQDVQLAIYSSALRELNREIGEFKIDDRALKEAAHEIEAAISGAQQKLGKMEDVGDAVMSIERQMGEAQLRLSQKRQAQRDAGALLTEREKEVIALQERAKQLFEIQRPDPQAGGEVWGSEEEEEEAAAVPAAAEVPAVHQKYVERELAKDTPDFPEIRLYILRAARKLSLMGLPPAQSQIVNDVFYPALQNFVNAYMSYSGSPTDRIATMKSALESAAKSLDRLKQLQR